MTRRLVSVLFVIIALAASCRASADGADNVHFSLRGGVCAIASPRQYNQAARLVNAPEIISVGASVHPQTLASVSFDFSFIDLGQGKPTALIENTPTTVESSSLSTAMLGLELRHPIPDGSGPYAATGFGIGRAFLGSVREGTRKNPGRELYPATKINAPVVTIGAGIRSARIMDGPRLQLDTRWVSLLAGHPRVSVVPITVGFVF